jgi:diguanylate cyclase (GGDEF)-like protein/putative nucleotidyltransferase with HDIG domain
VCSLTWKAKSYITLIVLGGFTTLAELPFHWQCDDLLRFMVFTALALALATSAWKVALPGFKGTMPVNFLFVLVGTAQLSAGETQLISVMGVIAQYFYPMNRKRSGRLIQAAFDVSSVAIAVRVATLTFDVVTPAFPVLDFPFRLALTAIAYFVCNTAPASLLIALTEKKSMFATWQTRFFWSFPYYLVGAAISALLWAVKMAAGWQTAVLVLPLVYIIYRSYSKHLEKLATEKNQAEIGRNHAEDEVAALHLRTIEALALAIEAKDQTTHDHLQRVQVYCTEVGRELGMNEIELRALLAASLLHDIGKLAVPEHIISKPGKLTPEEFEKMKVHPVVGAEILESVRFPYPVVPIVRHHHEKWDGSGYPDGLRAEAIPLGARILSAVDCFDALSSDRQYRPALPIDESMAYLESEAGRSFDPRVVAVMAMRYRELEVKAREHSDNERAKLSVDVKVARGDAPAAGFAEEGARSGVHPSEFIGSIAAARAEAQFLFSLSQDLTQSIDLSTLLMRLADKLCATIPFDTIAYYHIEGETLNPLFVRGNEEELFRRLRIPVGQGLSGWVVHERKTILNGNPAVEPGFLHDRNIMTHLRSALSVPVEGESGVIGALTLYSMIRDRYSREHRRVLMAVATRLAHQVENSLRFQKATGDAYTDELTGLSNSRWLVAHLSSTCERAAAEKETFAVLVIDLDGFKLLNDTHGHLRGNDALRAIAEASRTLLPPASSIARMGGDEFVVVLPDCNATAAAAIGLQIQMTVEQVGVTLVAGSQLSASWGVSIFGEDGETPENLVAEADRRMYENKRAKKGRMGARLTRLAAGVEGRPEVPAGPVLREPAARHQS